MQPAAINWQIMLLIPALAFAPGIFWLWYFYRKDMEPEPLPLVLSCFAWGMFSTVPAMFAEGVFHVSMPVDLVVVAPIVEEFCKFLAVYLTVYRRHEFEEPMDGVVYAASAALGFASLENALYLYKVAAQDIVHLELVTILRAFFSVPAHALFSIMWGYALGRAKFSGESKGKRLVAVGLALAMSFHALFNFLSQLDVLWGLGMIVLIPVMWGAANRRIAAAELRSPHRSKKLFKVKLRESADHLATRVRSARWYDNRAIVIILLFFLFFPAGLYALWMNTTFSRPEKASYIVLWAFMSGLLIAGTAR